MGLTTSVPARAGSELRLDEIRLDPRESVALGRPGDDALVYCGRGTGELVLASERHPLVSRSATLVLAGEKARVTAGDEGLYAPAASVGPGAERHAPLGARAFVAAAGGSAEGATGGRAFDVLLGPHNGSTRATMFVGFVPPGKPPWHYHLYDEIVAILAGSGRLHRAEGVEELATGSVFRLGPREPHAVENAGVDVLELLGVFTPAGSPAAAYVAGEDLGT